MDNSAAYQLLIQSIDQYFINIGRGFNPRPKKPLRYFFALAWCLFACVYLQFYLFFQPSPLYITCQQFWGFFTMFHTFAKALNYWYSSEQIESLVKWFGETYTSPIHVDYRPLRDKYLKAHLRVIKMAILICKVLWSIAVTFYIAQPVLMRTGELPTPLYIDGLPDSELPYWIYYPHYLWMTCNGLMVYFAHFGGEAFYLLSVSILGYRLALIGDILRLLNYQGARDVEKDRRIIKDAYLMHLEVLHFTEEFQRYFYFYGLIHLGSPMMVMAMLLYILASNGFDLMSVTVALSFFCQISISAFFAQQFAAQADDLTEAIYNLNWDDLHLDEQKSILMLLIASQGNIRIRAGGFFEMNYALITQILKFESSFCALLMSLK